MDDLDQVAGMPGREFGDASAWIGKNHDALTICRTDYPVQAAARVSTRDEDVL